MQVSSEKLPKSQVKLTVELTVQEFAPYLSAAVQEVAREVALPGFRPGKAPYEILERQVGAMRIYQRAAEKAAEATYPGVIRDQQMVTIGPPQVSVNKLAPGNPYIYTATVTLLPKVTLGNYKKISLAHRTVEVVQKDIDETVTHLRDMFATEKRVTRQAQRGDKLEIDMQTYVDSVPIDGGSGTKQPVIIGEGHFIPGFEEAIIGLAEGQSKEFTLKFPKEYHRKDLAGRPVAFKVKVGSVYQRDLPAIDQSFAQRVGRFEKLDDLYEQVRKNIHQERTEKEQQRWELAVIDDILAKSTFEEIPGLLIESELNKMMHELEHEVTHQGMKYEDYLTSIKKTPDDLKKEFRPKAVKRIQTAIALREIALVEQISVTDDEVTAEIKKEKERYQGSSEVLQQIEREEYRDYLRNILQSRKVFQLFGDKRTE